MLCCSLFNINNPRTLQSLSLVLIHRNIDFTHCAAQWFSCQRCQFRSRQSWFPFICTAPFMYGSHSKCNQEGLRLTLCCLTCSFLHSKIGQFIGDFLTDFWPPLSFVLVSLAVIGCSLFGVTLRWTSGNSGQVIRSLSHNDNWDMLEHPRDPEHDIRGKENGSMTCTTNNTAADRIWCSWLHSQKHIWAEIPMIEMNSVYFS